MKDNKTLRIVLAAALLVSVLFLFWNRTTPLNPPQNSTQDITPLQIGGAFRLVNQEGVSVTEKDFLGTPYLVFFGFTHCPDICPAKLFEITALLDKLALMGVDIKALFITVDWEKDTPAVLQQYLSNFHKNITGLTGSEAEISETIKAFRAYARKVPLETDYTYDHSAGVYLYDAKGQFVRMIDPSDFETVQKTLENL